MRRRTKLGIAFIAILAVVAFLYNGRFGSTPPFRDASGVVIQGSVAEMSRVKLGGVEQSITIRGRNAKAPILIWLHGGPGQDETGLSRLYNGELEDHFVVVYWTQRGAGRSYDSSIPAASMTLQQFVADLNQLISVLKSRFHRNKVVLAGHSWGTNIGVSYTQQYPENVAAYVGISQIANAAEGERRSYAWAIAEAERRNDHFALSQIRKIGPPPLSMTSSQIMHKWINKFGGGYYHIDVSLFQLMGQSFRASEMTWYDGIKFKTGGAFSQNALSARLAKIDWLHSATKFAVPVFVVEGRHDRSTDAILAHEYFDKIEAPAKQFRWFEKSAHCPPFEEPAAFNAFIINQVLPLALSAEGPRSPADGRTAVAPVVLGTSIH
jgi:proline iminopeptidase